MIFPRSQLEDVLAHPAQASIEKKKLLVIVNPYASTVSDRLRHLVVYALAGRYEVDAVDTQAKGHATEICKEAAHEGYDAVVAFGGDGTVNEVANGLLHSSTPLACLPGGSANVFGKMLGVPSELVKATERLLALAESWPLKAVDVGVVNGRAFTFASGVGLDASVVKRVDASPRLKAKFGPWFFTLVAFATFARHYRRRPPKLVLDAGSESLAGVTAIVQNGSPFTYFRDRPIHIADGPRLDSGLLGGCVLHKATFAGMPSIALRAFSSKAKVIDDRRITGVSGVKELRIASADGRLLPLQVDGDYLGEVDEARYSVMPAALRVLA